MNFQIGKEALWSPLVQVGMIAIMILIANILRRKIRFFRDSLLPTAVLAGFLLLGFKLLGWISIDTDFFEAITYHGIALGFIALSLRSPERTQQNAKGSMVGLKSGAIIVSSYLVQGIFGLLVSIGLAYTFMPTLFKAAGVLLPMGYGQGPGQANNIGTTYEALGFTGGRSFGLAIAAAGYLVACIIGVVYLSIVAKKRKIQKSEEVSLDENITVDVFQEEGEIPIAESVDKLSVQVALVLGTYFITFAVTAAITSTLQTFAPGLAETLNPLLWGFNFMIGAGIAILARSIMHGLRKKKIMTRKYQNNYLLSRISGLAFDIMIVAGIASINLVDLKGLWIPFAIMTIGGAVITLIHVQIVCKVVYKEYYYEGMISMFGMMTGTISSGILLLREIDPRLKTPAANNLVIGSSYAIMLAIPILIFVGMAPKSTSLLFLTLVAMIAYLVILLLLIFKAHPKNKTKWYFLHFNG